MSKTLEIHLATYNGAAFLPDLLDSLLDQSDTSFVLKARDDGSSDETVDILRGYEETFDGRLVLDVGGTPTGTAKGNFARLLENCASDYVLWADQDDVWERDKVAEQRRLLEKAESDFGDDCPIYAFTDATPVDTNLKTIVESYFDYKKLDPDTIGLLRQCLVCPPMIGCASGVNRALYDLVLPVPEDEVTGHDWWAFLLAAACGRIVFSRKSTLRYRLHGSNVSQQQVNSIRSYAGSGNMRNRVRRGMMLRWRQARAVSARLPETAPEQSKDTIARFLEIEDMSAAMRRYALLRHGFLYPDLNRSLAMLALG